MFTTTIIRSLSAIVAGFVHRRRHLPAALVTAAALLLAMAGPAAAAPVNPIRLNKTNWSGIAGFGSTPPAWYKDASGVVHLQGAAKQTSASGGGATVLGRLPRAAAPTNRVVYTIVHTFAGTYADLAITPKGQIDLIGPRPPALQDLSFVSLEGITYQQANTLPASGITINATNWSGSAGFGSTAPAWYKDSSGVVHIEGAAKQTSTSGATANVLGTLPPAARPVVNVFTIVHTFAGTYADVGIATDGTINLIGPRPPAVQDLSFVSLEGITFAQNQQISGFLINSANWGFAGFGTAGLGWYKDSSGIVHLVGAAKQVSVGGPNANLIGTLPNIASPTRTVYTIVHTLAGTYADLSVAPNGEIRVINPRPPAVTDLSFLSLESITYRQ